MSFFKTFKSGQIAPASGVYAVMHSTPHRRIERVVYVKGSRFQRCRTCPLGVLYRLEEASIPVSSITAADARFAHQAPVEEAL